MIRQAAVWSVALLLPLMAACGKRDPVANTPLRERGVAPNTPGSSLGTQESGSQLPARMEPQLAEITATDQPPETTTAEEAAPDAPEHAPRNLQTELETLLGSPVDCLKERPASGAPGQLDISLSANVMPSGAVGRGEVSAPGLAADEVACIRARVESLRFAQPIENAPVSVNGSVTLTPRIAAAVPAAAAVANAADGGGMPQ